MQEGEKNKQEEGPALIGKQLVHRLDGTDLKKKARKTTFKQIDE